jgi:hypothetical protein
LRGVDAVSFDLAVMHVDAPVDASQASVIYRELGEGKDTPPEPGTSIDSFYQELAARHPDLERLPDDEIDGSPWSVSPEVSGGAVLMCVKWSHADGMAAHVKSLAAAHGLACYDPQEGVVYLPPTLSN